MGQDREGGEGDGMTGRHRASQPAPDLPDEARLLAEIGDDRLRERFLIRAALVAAILVAMVIMARMVWL